MNQEEIDLYNGLREIVNERAGKSIEAQIKVGNVRIDEASIQKKCSEEFFHELEEFMTSVSKDVTAFFSLLKEDDLQLYKELEQATSGNDEALMHAETLHDMIELKKAHRITGKLLDSVYQLASHHYTSGNLEKAFLYFNWLCLVDEKNPQMWYLKGLAELNMKQYNDALASFQQVIAIDSNYVSVYTQLMNCLILMGDQPTAKRIYESFTKEVDPKAYSDDKLFNENLASIRNVLFNL